MLIRFIVSNFLSLLAMQKLRQNRLSLTLSLDGIENFTAIILKSRIIQSQKSHFMNLVSKMKTKYCLRGNTMRKRKESMWPSETGSY